MMDWGVEGTQDAIPDKIMRRSRRITILISIALLGILMSCANIIFQPIEARQISKNIEKYYMEEYGFDSEASVRYHFSLAHSNRFSSEVTVHGDRDVTIRRNSAYLHHIYDKYPAIICEPYIQQAFQTAALKYFDDQDAAIKLDYGAEWIMEYADGRFRPWTTNPHNNEKKLSWNIDEVRSAPGLFLPSWAKLKGRATFDCEPDFFEANIENLFRELSGNHALTAYGEISGEPSRGGKWYFIVWENYGEDVYVMFNPGRVWIAFTDEYVQELDIVDGKYTLLNKP